MLKTTRLLSIFRGKWIYGARLRNQKEATLAEYLQTYEASKAVQTQLVADIAQGYFNLLMLDKQLEIAKTNFALK